MKFLKKFNKPNENPHITVEGIVEIENDITLKVSELEDKFFQHMYDRLIELNDGKYEEMTLKKGEKYNVIISSWYDFVLDSDVDSINEQNTFEDMIETAENLCNFVLFSKIE